MVFFVCKILCMLYSKEVVFVVDVVVVVVVGVLPSFQAVLGLGPHRLHTAIKRSYIVVPLLYSSCVLSSRSKVSKIVVVDERKPPFCLLLVISWFLADIHVYVRIHIIIIIIIKIIRSQSNVAKRMGGSFWSCLSTDDHLA